jgi:site-specific DNA-methyltransferase (cytosine-N4-specific)
MIKPYYQDEFITLYCGDVREILPQLSVNMVQSTVTSPPYYGLRDYNTGIWEGGHADCDHKAEAWAADQGNVGPATLRANEAKSRTRSGHICRQCGAVRIDQQIGLEVSPAAFLQTLVEVFHEVRRVSRSNATAWVNLGDSYAAAPKTRTKSQAVAKSTLNGSKKTQGGILTQPNKIVDGFKAKDMIGIPWRVAFALQDAGWWLRQDIIWSKPNPMPESVSDRCTKAHEYIFLLATAAKYFYDAEAIKEPSSENTHPRRALADLEKPVGGWA